MVRKAKTRINYSQKQQKVMSEILSHINSSQIDFLSIKNQYNEKCFDQIEGFVPKSYKAVKNKIKSELKIGNYFWSNQLNQKMLDCVSKGLQWKDISRLSQFSQHQLTRKIIKNKFQCQARFKFGVMYREVYRSPPPLISDVTMKTLLQQQSIKSYYFENLLNTRQKDCLLENIHVFKTNSNKQQSRIARNYLSKQKILNLVNVSTSLRFLVDTIVKLNFNRNLESRLSLDKLIDFHFSRSIKQQISCQSNQCGSFYPLQQMKRYQRRIIMQSEPKNEQNLRNVTLIEFEIDRPPQIQSFSLSQQAFMPI